MNQTSYHACIRMRNNMHQIGQETSSHFLSKPMRASVTHTVGHHKHHLHGKHSISTPFLQPYGPTITIVAATPPRICISNLPLRVHDTPGRSQEQQLQQRMHYLFHCNNHGCSFVKHQFNTPKRRSNLRNNHQYNRRRPPLMNLQQ